MAKKKAVKKVAAPAKGPQPLGPRPLRRSELIVEAEKKGLLPKGTKKEPADHSAITKDQLREMLGAS